MKKELLKRGLLGFPLGIAIGHIITIVISLFSAKGYYSPCVPSLGDTFGSEIAAVIFQSLLCGILGTSFASASVIWELETWSIAKQTGIYFLVTAATMFPIAWFSHWMKHSLSGFLLYAGIFVGIFIFIWLVQYLIWKNKIEAINEKMETERTKK